MTVDILSMPSTNANTLVGGANGNKGKPSSTSSSDDGVTNSFASVMAEVEKPDHDADEKAVAVNEQPQDESKSALAAGQTMDIAPIDPTLTSMLNQVGASTVSQDGVAAQIAASTLESSQSLLPLVSKDSVAKSSVDTSATTNIVDEKPTVASLAAATLGVQAADEKSMGIQNLSAESLRKATSPEVVDGVPAQEISTAEETSLAMAQQSRTMEDLLRQVKVSIAKQATQSSLDTSSAGTSSRPTGPDMPVLQTFPNLARSPLASPLRSLIPGKNEVSSDVVVTSKLQKASQTQSQSATAVAQANFAENLLSGKNVELPQDLKKTLVEASVTRVDVPLIRSEESLSIFGSIARPEDSVRSHHVFTRDVADFVQSPQPVSTASSATGVLATSVAASPAEVYVAEQVSYWISKDVQKAEMKLDGLGLDPVQVNITMNGNEAQIAFRTDELQTRAILENASTHLKDMLQREGVMLMGVSVGSSNAGDTGGQERKQRQEFRQSTLTMAQQLAPVVRTQNGASAGRALDLFV